MSGILHVYYRATNIATSHPRPHWFSKELCLRSFLAALAEMGRFKLTFIWDSLEANRYVDLLPPSTEVYALNRIGNAASFRHALTLAAASLSSRFVYFAEDDYLYLPDSIVKLVECLDTSSVDYVTLYDHPARYGKQCQDLPVPRSSVFHTYSHHWRQVESTCMSFGAKSKVLKADISRIGQYLSQTEYPADREMWRNLQCLSHSSTALKADTEPCRVLVGPIPSLATHCDLRAGLAPTIDWELVAQEVCYGAYGEFDRSMEPN